MRRSGGEKSGKSEDVVEGLHEVFDRIDDADELMSGDQQHFSVLPAALPDPAQRGLHRMTYLLDTNHCIAARRGNPSLWKVI